MLERQTAVGRLKSACPYGRLGGGKLAGLGEICPWWYDHRTCVASSPFGFCHCFRVTWTAVCISASGINKKEPLERQGKKT